MVSLLNVVLIGQEMSNEDSEEMFWTSLVQNHGRERAYVLEDLLACKNKFCSQSHAPPPDIFQLRRRQNLREVLALHDRGPEDPRRGPEGGLRLQTPPVGLLGQEGNPLLGLGSAGEDAGAGCQERSCRVPPGEKFGLGHISTMYYNYVQYKNSQFSRIVPSPLPSLYLFLLGIDWRRRKDQEDLLEGRPNPPVH